MPEGRTTRARFCAGSSGYDGYLQVGEAACTQFGALGELGVLAPNP
jgi:hypothetical protein